MAETNVLLFDGQTTVIGGLNKESKTKSEAGVPSLKDIPLLGWLFKNTSNSNEMEDLLIFITPHILKERPFEEPLQPRPAEQPPPAIKPDAVPQ
jgi:type IV pilus assembly protein PilQ